jgi:hypothetical protein
MSEFFNSDLRLAAFRRLIGHEPVRIEGPLRRRVFVFRLVPEADLSAYDRGTHAAERVGPYGNILIPRAALDALLLLGGSERP